MMNQAFPEASIKDITTLIPAAFAVIVIGILLLIKSSIAMLATVAVVLLSILGGMGAAGWMGVKLCIFWLPLIKTSKPAWKNKPRSLRA